MPLLRARAAEWDALGWLPRDCGPVLPLLDVTPVPTGSGLPVNPTDHLRHVVRRAALHWGGRPLLVDGHDRSGGGRRPVSPGAYRQLADWSRTTGVVALPVLAPDDGEELLRSAAYLVARLRAGAAIRLETRDVATGHDADRRLRQHLDRLLDAVRLTPPEVVLLLDLQQLPPHGPPPDDVARLHDRLALLPHLEQWRAVVLAGTSAPHRLDDRHDTPPLRRPLPRQEWLLWRSLLDAELPRHPDFGDYAGFAARPPVQQGRTRHPALRYSTADGGQLLARRRARPDEGFRAFVDICRDVVHSRYYLGPTFSWGDGQLQSKARYGGSPGTPQTWREIAVEHHVRTVLHQLATQVPPARAAGRRGSDVLPTDPATSPAAPVAPARAPAAGGTSRGR